VASGTSGSKPPIDPARARELLESERARVEGELADIERRRAGELEEIQDEVNPEDDAELIEDEAVDEALMRSLKQRLQAIERAEKRLEEGTYGFSVQSGEPIPAQRLEKVPWAERTIEEEER
jgi:DnaK suppressor protein